MNDSLPSDVQRAPSDRLIYGQSFEMPADADIAAIVANRVPPVISVWRKDCGWIVKGSDKDTGAKQYMHANTTCLRFQIVEVVDLPPSHALRFQAIRMNGWLVDGKPEDGNIKAVMGRFEGAPALSGDDIVCPAGWTVNPTTGRGVRIDEMQRHDGWYITPLHTPTQAAA